MRESALFFLFQKSVFKYTFFLFGKLWSTTVFGVFWLVEAVLFFTFSG